MSDAVTIEQTPLAASSFMNKVPQVTLAFWVIKIAATTLGETGGDALSMTLDLGYAVSTLILFGFFATSAFTQISSGKFHPFLYWTVIVATTMVGTTMADFADRSLGVGYVGGSLILFAILVATLGCWRYAIGSVSVNRIASPRVRDFLLAYHPVFQHARHRARRFPRRRFRPRL